MPCYEYYCESCKTFFDLFNKIENRASANCPVCDNESKKDFVGSLKGQVRHIFQPFWHKHLDRKPIYITSMKQLKDECKKRGLTSPYAEGQTELWGEKMPEKAWRDRPRKIFSEGGR